VLLAIDTSTAQVGVALLDDGQLVVESTWNTRVHHSVELAPAIAELLRRAGAGSPDVRAIAIAIGPGSFTALRVGLAFAKGLALARQIPLIGVPTLDILAGAQPWSDLPLAAVLRAGRARIAVNIYRARTPSRGAPAADLSEQEADWQAESAPRITTIEELARSITKTTLVAGELSAEDRQRLARKRARVVLAPLHRCVRRPSVLAEIGWRRLNMSQVDDVASLSPLYVHSGEAIAT